MIANCAWYDMEVTCGMVPCGSRPTVFRTVRQIAKRPAGETPASRPMTPRRCQRAEGDEAHHHRIERALRSQPGRVKRPALAS